MGFIRKTKKTIQKQLFIELNASEQIIYEYLLKGGKQLLDIIAIDCNIPLFQLSSTLLQMELKGIINPLPGKMFEII